MPFFDFHLHPTLKPIFSITNPATNSHKLSPWKVIDTTKIPFLLNWCSDFKYILQSQGNLRQLADTNCNLVCVALYIPEEDMLTDDMIKQGAKSKLGIYLQQSQVDAIVQGVPYDILTTNDWKTLTDAAEFNVTDKKVKPIFKREDYNETDSDTVHLVFSVEGCHTLTSKLGTFDVNEIIQNIDSLRKMAALLSINITHMQQSPLCNHAYGMQFLKSNRFKPTGDKISDDGITIIKHCYSNSIMIDLKHMSLAARKQLYLLRESAEFKNINQPLVCTHAGFTGISMAEIPDYILAVTDVPGEGYKEIKQGKPVKYGDGPKPSFNTSSINLYDEEILIVLKSGGMIGLSLDKRILGYQEFEEESGDRENFPIEKEYISLQEEVDFLRNTHVEIGQAFDEFSHAVMQWDDIKDGGTVLPAQGDFHLEHFMAHILHVIVVAQNNNYDVATALNQLCIGSDFDGVQITTTGLENVGELPNLTKELLRRGYSETDIDKILGGNMLRVMEGF